MAGGLEEVFTALSAISYCDEQKLLKHLKAYDKKLLYKKAGFFFSLLQPTYLTNRFFDVCKENVTQRFDDIRENKNDSGKRIDEWKDKLALKGGTAINLFYRNLPCLSVDIDLDYLGQTKEEAVADKESIRTYLKNALFQKGYALSDTGKYHFALNSYVFQYQNNDGNRDNIKVKINFLDRAHTLPLSKTKIAAFGYNGEA